MAELKRKCVKMNSAAAVSPSGSVFNITLDMNSGTRELNPDLVSSTGLKNNFQDMIFLGLIDLFVNEGGFLGIPAFF